MTIARHFILKTVEPTKFWPLRLKSEGQDVRQLLRNFLDNILDFWILRLFVWLILITVSLCMFDMFMVLNLCLSVLANDIHWSTPFIEGFSPAENSAILIKLATKLFYLDNIIIIIINIQRIRQWWSIFKTHLKMNKSKLTHWTI